MAGNAGLSADADAQLQSGGRRQRAPVHQPDVLRRAAAGQPHERTECTLDESQRPGSVPASVHSRSRIPAEQSVGDQDVRRRRRKTRCSLRADAFNFLNHPLVSFNNNDNTNLNMGNLNFAVAGQPLTATQLRAPSFGLANIKYGSRLIELGAKFTF